VKKKNDRIDTSKICDCLRCDFLPERHMASTAIRERRRTLRYPNLLVRQMVQMKIKINTLQCQSRDVGRGKKAGGLPDSRRSRAAEFSTSRDE
jgi:hypothetical protein